MNFYFVRRENIGSTSSPRVSRRHQPYDRGTTCFLHLHVFRLHDTHLLRHFPGQYSNYGIKQELNVIMSGLFQEMQCSWKCLLLIGRLRTLPNGMFFILFYHLTCRVFVRDGINSVVDYNSSRGRKMMCVCVRAHHFGLFTMG